MLIVPPAFFSSSFSNLFKYLVKIGDSYYEKCVLLLSNTGLLILEKKSKKNSEKKDC